MDKQPTHGYVEHRPRPLSEFDFNPTPVPGRPDLTITEQKSPTPKASGYSNNVPIPDNTAPPSGSGECLPGHGK